MRTPWVIGVSLLASSFSAWAVPSFCNEDFRVIVNNQNSGIVDGRTQIIDNEADYCDVWNELYSLQWPAPACDTSLVDFSTEFAVLVAVGERWDGCHNVDIGCVVRTPADRIGVVAIETEPGPMCLCTDNIVYPSVLAVVERPFTQAQFRTIVQPLQCP